MPLDSAIQEVLYETKSTLPDVSRYMPGRSPVPDPALVAEAACLLLNAKSPVILCGRVSRDPGAWAEQAKLVEQLDAAVFTDLKVGASFPSEHELHVVPRGMFIGGDSLSELRSADVVLSLDWVDLAGTLRQAWPMVRHLA